MTNAKITGMIIGMILIGMIGGSFTYIFADFNKVYSSDSFSQTNSSLALYTAEFDKVINQTEDIKNEVQDISFDSGFIDLLGAIFNSGYTALQISGQSFSIFETMTNNLFMDLGIPGIGALIKTGIIAIVIILLFVGIFIKILVKANDI